MAELPHILERMMLKFARRAKLQENDRRALLDLPFTVKTIEAGKYIAREGAPSTASALILSGIAFRHKLTVEGSRQIVSIHIAGDFVDLEGSLLAVADHNVQALNRCEIAVVPSRALIALIDKHPAIARAMWVDTLVDGSIHREWVMNVGRRDAKARIAHVLCEFARRMEVAGLASHGGYEFPMTQDQLADATGLTPVHVNRMLKTLEKEGLLKREKRFLHFPDWEGLRKVAGFNELHLHLDQVGLKFPPSGPALGAAHLLKKKRNPAFLRNVRRQAGGSRRSRNHSRTIGGWAGGCCWRKISLASQTSSFARSTLSCTSA